MIHRTHGKSQAVSNRLTPKRRHTETSWRQFWNITSGIYAKYHVQIMVLFVYTATWEFFCNAMETVIVTCRYFKLSWNTTALSQSNCRNFSYSSVMIDICFLPSLLTTVGDVIVTAQKATRPVLVRRNNGLVCGLWNCVTWSLRTEFLHTALSLTVRLSLYHIVCWVWFQWYAKVSHLGKSGWFLMPMLDAIWQTLKIVFYKILKH